MVSPANDEALHDQKMTVYLQVRKTVALEVRGSASIRSIKSELYKREGICEKNQELFINGDQLKDDQTVVDCGIQEGNTLHMVLQNNNRVKLLIAIPSKSKDVVIEARTYFSIGNIKYIMSEKEGIEPNRYNLLYDGRVLEDSKTLSSLGMPNELVMLQLVFNPSDTISFSVITPTGRTVPLNVKVLYSVSDVKAIVGGLIGNSFVECGLLYQGKQLEGSKSLAFYDVQEGSVLQMAYLKFPIFVKTSGKTITLYVQRCDSIEVVVDKACSKLLVSNPCFGMKFKGKRLEMKHDLAYYNIQKDATLEMCFQKSTTLMSFQNVGGPEDDVPKSTTTIRDLKAMIQEKVTAPVKEIYFGLKQLVAY